MNKIFTCLLVSSLSILSMHTFAQEDKHFSCGLNHQLKELYKRNFDLNTNYARFSAYGSHNKN